MSEQDKPLLRNTLFKVLGADGSSCHGGIGKWSLPRGGRPGRWMPPVVGPLVPCRNGYHLCRPEDLVLWLGPRICTAEYRGERLDCADKVVVRQPRLLVRVGAWTEHAARSFTCDCVERALLRERAAGREPDERCWAVVATARSYAARQAPAEELAAAGAAAWDAARDATWDAWAAAWAAAQAAALSAGDAAGEAACDAARAAAGYAARPAAGHAARLAWDAERAWQTERLFTYLQMEADA